MRACLAALILAKLDGSPQKKAINVCASRQRFCPRCWRVAVLEFCRPRKGDEHSPR
jgi:hypothetical protein